MRTIIGSICMIIMLLGSLSLINNEKTVENYKLPVDEHERWEIGWTQVIDGQEIVEFVPKGQTVEDWKEMITVQTFDYKVNTKWDIDPYSLMVVCRRGDEKYGSQIQYVTIIDEPSNVIYEWYAKDCPEVEDQDEITRLYIENNHLVRMAYVRKGERMDEKQRLKWIDWIKN
ncbi:MAG: hypothetical protein JHC93_05070 [Parachlamydiales bacterium]|nr:hypothetical protein [Parachlamydiales bacterium]